MKLQLTKGNIISDKFVHENQDLSEYKLNIPPNRLGSSSDVPVDFTHVKELANCKNQSYAPHHRNNRGKPVRKHTKNTTRWHKLLARLFGKRTESCMLRQASAFAPMLFLERQVMFSHTKQSNNRSGVIWGWQKVSESVWVVIFLPGVWYIYGCY